MILMVSTTEFKEPSQGKFYNADSEIVQTRLKVRATEYEFLAFNLGTEGQSTNYTVNQKQEINVAALELRGGETHFRFKDCIL